MTPFQMEVPSVIKGYCLRWLTSFAEMSVLANGRIKPTSMASEASYREYQYVFQPLGL